MSHQVSSPSLKLGHWSVDLAGRTARTTTRTIQLPPRQARLLAALASAAPDYVSRDALVAEAWGVGALSDQALHNAISKLRALFDDDAAAPWLIQTERNRGYRLMIIPAEITALTTGQADRADWRNLPARHPRVAGLAIVIALIASVVVGRSMAVDPLARLLESGNWVIETERDSPQTSR
ncbi:helix-turn-helix domain-containing protein [Maricaulis sp.]|uniref:winged helix-turn-helix domain-containing protein n=1 Tax=Maricaulis sp. TaxID=1486257 RepID=UPI0025C51C4E|nr:helix-turn-helix domain-containing protein [Maricaulis sp.]